MQKRSEQKTNENVSSFMFSWRLGKNKQEEKENKTKGKDRKNLPAIRIKHKINRKFIKDKCSTLKVVEHGKPKI